MEMEKTEKARSRTRPAPREEVVREYAPIGRYRIRLLQDPRRPESDPSLDIREYIDSPTFQGFTRRGVRLTDRGQMDLLRDVLTETLERNGFAKPAPGTLPLER